MPNLALVSLVIAAVFVLFFTFLALLLPTISPDYREEIKKLLADDEASK